MLEALYALVGTGALIGSIWWVERTTERRHVQDGVDFETAADEAIALTQIPRARRPAPSEELLTVVRED